MFVLSVKAIVTNFLKAVFAANVGSSLDPLTVCEVGDSHGCAAHSDGILGKAGDSHPSRHIVSVDRHLGLVADSLKESAQTEVIHSVVTANYAVVDVLLPKRMHVLLIEFLHRYESVLIGCAVKHSVDEDTAAVLAPGTLCTLKNAASGISSRNGGVVCENDGLAVSALDAGGYYIAHCEVEVGILKILALVVFDPTVYRAALGCHRGKHYHSVSSVDVEAFCDGTQLVSGIYLSVSVHIVVKTVVAVFVAESNLVAKVVVISALAVKDLAEKTLFDHIENKHLVLAVAAVFEHHYGNSGALVRLYEIPALIEVVCAADLGTYVFTKVHTVDADLNMSVPGCGNYNTVHLGLVYNFSVIGAAVEGLISANFLAEINAFLNSVLVKVANSDNVNVLNVLETGLEQTASASAETDNGNVELFHGV